MFESAFLVSPAHSQTSPNISPCSFSDHEKSNRAEARVGFAARYLRTARLIFCASRRFNCCRVVMLLSLRNERSIGVSSGIGSHVAIIRSTVFVKGQPEVHGRFVASGRSTRRHRLLAIRAPASPGRSPRAAVPCGAPALLEDRQHRPSALATQSCQERRRSRPRFLSWRSGCDQTAFASPWGPTRRSAWRASQKSSAVAGAWHSESGRGFELDSRTYYARHCSQPVRVKGAAATGNYHEIWDV